MRFIADHDLHIHSQLSLCSNDPLQNPAAILEYGVKNGFKTLCLTDHMWDSTIPGASEWYKIQTFDYICKALPLPQADGTKFLFGCETELDRNLQLAISRKVLDAIDFCIIPTTHLHMDGLTVIGTENAAERAKLWIERFDAVLDMDLPFEKIGIAHLDCSLIYKGHYVEVLDLIPDHEYHRLFARAAKCGVGIELNMPSLDFTPEEEEPNYKMFRIAKEEGCKFYLGTDAHHPDTLETAKANFENIIDHLGLTEDDKFAIAKG